MSGYEQSPDYGTPWAGYRAAAAVVALMAGAAFAFTSCAPEAGQVEEPAPSEAAATAAPAEPARSGGEDPCTARLPTGAGTEFAGAVVHVIDGDSICVGPADGDGSTWIEVRLMDFDAPETREAGGQEAEATLLRLVGGREAQCVVTRSDRSGATRSYDRVHAVCRVDGETIGDMMRAAGVAEGGN